jgi:hypothetical protein
MSTCPLPAPRAIVLSATNDGDGSI